MVLVSCDCDSWIVKWFYSYMLLNGCYCHLVKILWVILFGEIYCEEILIEIVSVEKSWVDLLDEHHHGEEEFRELVRCYELLWHMWKYIRRRIVILMTRLYNNWLRGDVWLEKFRFLIKVEGL